MTTKLLLEFTFVIFLLQVYKTKSYFTPLKIKQEKFDSNRENVEKFINKKILNKIFIILSMLYGSIYFTFYIIGIELFKETNLVVFPILMIGLLTYDIVKTLLEFKSGMLWNSIIDKLEHPMTTAYLLYFVYYVLR